MGKKTEGLSAGLLTGMPVDALLSGQNGETENFYRNMIELSPDSVIVFDERGFVLLCNETATKVTGYPRSELLDRHYTELPIVNKDDMQGYAKLFEEVLSQMTAGPVEVFYHRKDGEPMWTEMRFNLLNIAGGTIVQATTRDITVRKRMELEIQEKNKQLDAHNEELIAANEELLAAEEELRASNEELQSANEELRDMQEQMVRSEKLVAIGQLAGGVGHELRNPLGAIKNAVYFIRRKLAGSEVSRQQPRVMEFLDILDEEVEASNKIISDLLGFSRVGRPAVSPVFIDGVIADALKQVNVPDAVRVAIKISADLGEIEIDPAQIKQVLQNIISNAVLAMPEGGDVVIAAVEKDNILELSVSDSGAGISEEFLGKIFDPLFTTRAKGIGLGLSVCKSIIERHEGRIEVTGGTGGGATFLIKLPMRANWREGNSGKEKR